MLLATSQSGHSAYRPVVIDEALLRRLIDFKGSSASTLALNRGLGLAAGHATLHGGTSNAAGMLVKTEEETANAVANPGATCSQAPGNGAIKTEARVETLHIAQVGET